GAGEDAGSVDSLREDSRHAQPRGLGGTCLCRASREGARVNRELAPLEQITSCHYCGVRVSADLAECRRHMIACPKHPAHELQCEIERLQQVITSAMDKLSNGDVEGGARVLRECFWGVK